MRILHILDIDINNTTHGAAIMLKRMVEAQNELVDARVFFPYKKKIANHNYDFKFYFSDSKKDFEKLCSEIKWDLIVFHYCFNIRIIPPYLTVRKKNLPYIITSHGSFMKNVFKKNTLRKFLYKSIFLDTFVKNSKGIIFNLETERLNSYYQSKKYSVIPNFIERNNNFLLNVTNQRIRLISISRVDLYYKKIDLFISSLEKIKHDLNPIDFEYLIYGDGNPTEIRKLNNVIKKSTFRDKIHFNGPIFNDKKFHELKNSDIFIQLSSSESMSLSITEALSCGTPCFVSDMTNLEVEFSKFHCGWVTKLNQKAISENFLLALKDYDKNKIRLRESARKYADHYFNLSKEYGKISIDAYTSLLK